MFWKLLFLCCFIASTTARRLPRLAGGKDAKPGQFPYQVNLYYKSTLNSQYPIAFGGGAILNEQWILTAAYNCYVKQVEIVVKAGNIHLTKQSKFEQVSNVVATFIHPEYHDYLGYNDIALIKLETPLTFNDFVKPIDLPKADSQPHGTGVLTGLGALTHMSNPILPETLQTLTLPIISNDECRTIIDTALGSDFSKEIDFFAHDYAFCTGPTETNQGYCLNDTGNPLVIDENGKKIIVGVATFGLAADCTTPNFPSIYTRVSASNDWIEKIMREN